jgi:hypothetical protein
LQAAEFLEHCIYVYSNVKQLPLGPKLPGREDDHSPPYNVQVKNASMHLWIYTSTPQYVFMAWFLVKHSDNFIFTLTLPLTLVKLHIDLFCSPLEVMVRAQEVSGVAFMKACYRYILE